MNRPTISLISTIGKLYRYLEVKRFMSQYGANIVQNIRIFGTMKDIVGLKDSIRMAKMKMDTFIRMALFIGLPNPGPSMTSSPFKEDFTISFNVSPKSLMFL